jgi:ribosomal protein S18 acetylase RimI-like enzyme
VNIRAATAADEDAIWHILEPTFRAGETYPIPRDISRADALAYWRSPGHTVFVAEDAGTIVGTYYLRANNRGGGDHVANCGYVVAPEAYGRGVARAMCAHSLEQARERKFTAVQFNFVVASNERAVRLWQSYEAFDPAQNASRHYGGELLLTLGHQPAKNLPRTPQPFGQK